VNTSSDKEKLGIIAPLSREMSRRNAKTADFAVFGGIHYMRKKKPGARAPGRKNK
jgi:hypothetical protein